MVYACNVNLKCHKFELRHPGTTSNVTIKGGKVIAVFYERIML